MWIKPVSGKRLEGNTCVEGSTFFVEDWSRRRYLSDRDESQETETGHDVSYIDLNEASRREIRKVRGHTIRGESDARLSPNGKVACTYVLRTRRGAPRSICATSPTAAGSGRSRRLGRCLVRTGAPDGGELLLQVHRRGDVRGRRSEGGESAGHRRSRAWFSNLRSSLAGRNHHPSGITLRR